MRPPASDPAPSTRATRFLRACRGEPVDTTPVWIMRQAGRYLPEYRAVRARAGSFLALCKNPELACEVTLQPIDRLGVDAAILFSDILIPLEAMGLGLTFEEGEGPRLEPVRDAAGVARLAVPDPVDTMRFVMDAVATIRRALDGKVPLIGFAGAPWTLFCYAVEGKGSKTWDKARRMLYEDPALAHALLDKLTRTQIAYLQAQVEAGAQALQLFDSWAGALPQAVYREFGLAYATRIIDALRPSGVPFIFFCNGGAAHLDGTARAGAHVLGVDAMLPLDAVRARIGDPRAVLQGNLDNCVLFASREVIAERARAVLTAGGEHHVFNLGHGILPETPPDSAAFLVETVHRIGAELRAAKDG